MRVKAAGVSGFRADAGIFIVLKVAERIAPRRDEATWGGARAVPWEAPCDPSRRQGPPARVFLVDTWYGTLAGSGVGSKSSVNYGIGLRRRKYCWEAVVRGSDTAKTALLSG